MLLAPLRWPVQAISRLPEALGPGVLLALALLILWFVFVQRGLPHLWHGLCRAAARALDLGVGLVLLPEYAMTQARRQRGEPAGRGAIALGETTDVLLDGAASFYARHQREPIRWKRGPWVLCALLLALSVGAWIAMDRLPDTAIAKYRLAQGYDTWHDVVSWAGVDRDVLPPPVVGRLHRRPNMWDMRLVCLGHERCEGWVVLRGDSGSVIVARHVDMSFSSTVVRFELSEEQARTSRRGRLTVESH